MHSTPIMTTKLSMRYNLLFLLGDEDKDTITIMNSKEFNSFMKIKSLENYDSTGRFHFYIGPKNGKIIEDRDIEIDISQYTNKFGI